MPNLVGLYDTTATPEALDRDLARMIAAVDLPAFGFTTRIATGPHLACGNVLTRVENNLAQPARDDGRGLWLMLDGEVLNAREVARGLGRPADAPLDDAEVALSAYLAYGLAFLDRLNGQFNVILADRGDRSCRVISDRLGSRVLFVAEDGPRVTFASEVKGVVAGRGTPTRAGGLGLLQLLASGAHVGDRTWLEGIQVLCPGTILDLRPSGRSRRRYFKLHFREGGPEMAEDAYVEGFTQNLRVATERCMRHRPGHKVAITLSGGLDSRSVALAIDPSHLPLTSLTYGAAESPDAMYAAELARVIGLDHHHIEGLWEELLEQSKVACDRVLGPSPSGRRGFYSSQVDRIAWRGEGMGGITGHASMIWHPLYRRHMRVMLNGACGDAMTGSHLTPNLLLGPKRAAVIADLTRRTLRQRGELLDLVLAPRFLARHLAELPEYLAATFADIDADEPMAIANVWDMENRQRRGTFSSFTIERYFCTCRSPFLDYELVDFLARVPPLYRFQQRVYKRMIVTQFPEARHVPWAYTRGPITASPAYEFAREAFNFARGRIARRLSRGKPQLAHWSFRDDVGILRADRDVALALEAFTRADHFPSEVLSAEGVRTLVARFTAGPDPDQVSQALLFSQLAGIAKCHELFLARSGPITVPPAADPANFGVDTSP